MALRYNFRLNFLEFFQPLLGASSDEIMLCFTIRQIT